MSDNKDNRDGRDRNQVAAGEDYEDQYMAEKMCLSPEEVRRAIQQVGNDRRKLEEFLGRGK